LNLLRLRGLFWLLVCVGVLGWAESARAAAEVRRFSFVISASPTMINAQDFNDKFVDGLNQTVLGPRGLEGLDKVGFGWFFDAQLRYFVRPNVAIEAGAGHLRSIVEREFLPTLNAGVRFRGEVLTVPVHVGGAYYLPPYNQGDFQARVFMGGGVVSSVYNRAKFQAEEEGTDAASTLGGRFRAVATGDSPSYYVETGVHMFFAARYSIMLGALYRSSVVREAQVVPAPGYPATMPAWVPETVDLDTGGLGARFALAIGL